MILLLAGNLRALRIHFEGDRHTWQAPSIIQIMISRASAGHAQKDVTCCNKAETRACSCIPEKADVLFIFFA